MIVDSKKLLDAGYLIVPECVPPDRLEPMRAHCEQMVERHKKWWAEQRTPDQPPGGEWEVGKQPRVLFDRVIDRQNHESVEFLLHENTYGISKQIMQTEDVVPTQFGMFCNPRTDHGPSDWHRDISPPAHGPVEAYYTDLLNNSPCYTQWNIALYDDDVFWLVPGSHRRFNTAAENQQLSISEHAPIGGGIPIGLRAGDGIVYLTPILHWGSVSPSSTGSFRWTSRISSPVSSARSLPRTALRKCRRWTSTSSSRAGRRVNLLAPITFLADGGGLHGCEQVGRTHQNTQNRVLATPWYFQPGGGSR